MRGVIAWLFWGLFSSFIVAQEVIRLPAVDPDPGVPPGQLISHPDSPSNLLQTPGTNNVAPASPPVETPQLPPGVRNGVFQKVVGEFTWLAPGGSQGLENRDARIEGIFALPCPKPTSPLIISPGFEVQNLETPAAVDLPESLYTAYTQFRWMSQVTPQLGLDFAVTPGVFSDFQQSSGKSFRASAHGAGAWTWNVQTKFVLGLAYLDMPDTNFLPIGGMIWTPNEDTSVELLFPRPKIARRVNWGGNFGDNKQDWVYLSGEFANDAWAMRRDNGTDTQVLLRDYRVILGFEHKVIGGLSSRFEIGYVFNRRVRYTDGASDFYPSDTVMLRGNLTY
jgi:hypothetical protein